jgi:peptide/nickel transport system substrate-binding protein
MRITDRFVLGTLFLTFLLALSGYLYYTNVVVLQGKVLFSRARTFEDFSVVVDALPQDFSLQRFDTVKKNIFLNVYEGLVRTDRFFRIRPALAYSWGNVDESGLIWEFKLRPNVTFHNGEVFTADHVLSSIAYYEEIKNEETLLLSASIDRVEKVSDTVIRIHTKYPDPLLLYRLSFLFLLPEKKDDLSMTPVGTGPFQVVAHNQEKVLFERYADYWGKLPAVKSATFSVVPDEQDRRELFLSGKVAILQAFSPDPSFIEEIKDTLSLEYYSVPSLEILYLVFHVGEFAGLERNPLTDMSLREGLTLAIDRQAIASIPAFARVLSQYASSGVFGYDPLLSFPSQDLERSKKLLSNRYLRLKLTLPQSYRLIGEAIRNQLDKVGVRVDLNIIPMEKVEDFLSGITEQRYQMYVVGYKFDIADLVEFFRSGVHTQGKGYGVFNGGAYSNLELDDQIERGERILDPALRLQLLHKIQQRITKEYMGVPLLELDKLYGKRKEVTWLPRMDGYILLSEVE